MTLLMQNASAPAVSDILAVPRGHAVTVAVQTSGTISAKLEVTTTDPSDTTPDVWVTFATLTGVGVKVLPPGFAGVRITLDTGTIQNAQASSYQSPALLVS